MKHIRIFNVLFNTDVALSCIKNKTKCTTAIDTLKICAEFHENRRADTWKPKVMCESDM